MGLFERCKVLVDVDAEGLDLYTFECQYGYRLRHLVSKSSVRERYYSESRVAENWVDFLELWGDLDTAYEKRTARASKHPVSCLDIRP